ncbi:MULTISPECIES: ATP-binding protein [unclassified Pseudonocardia]|uniref:sensor histidine kinase n=1 Tax=unclassified Pseudonocardia TaxID=2619320 RepID=UPI0007610F0C|nr:MULTISPECIES: ATP-binding protein [unclassified Pseudonocardia]
MTTAEPRDDRPGPLPGTRAGDAALASAVLLTALMEVLSTRVPGAPVLPGLLPGAAGTVAGTLTATALAAIVLVRRYRPRRAYALVAIVSVVQFAMIATPTTYVWPVLAFAVARAPGRAAAVLVLGWAGAVAGFTAAGVPMFGDLGTAAGAAVGGGLVIAVLVLAGGAAGRYTRAAARREDRIREETERARRSAALRTERARIAEEIGSGVLSGLHRLVGLTRRWEPAGAGGTVPVASEAELRALRDQARSVLAAMRRVLGILRSPDSPDPTDPADPPGSSDSGTGSPGPGTGSPGPAGQEPRAPDRRRGWPLPDRAGLAAQAAFLVVALPAAALPVPPSLDPDLARLLGTFGLPFESLPGLLVVALQFALIAWWRTAPVPAVLIAGVCTVVTAGLGATNLFADTSWLLLVWGAAAYTRPRWSGPAVTVSTLTWLAGAMTFGYASAVGGTAWLLFACLGTVPVWVAGVLVRRHRLETEQRHRDRAEAGDRDAVTGERLRVARDLHDVVAHHVSAIAVQAGAARMAADPAVRAEAVAHVAESGRRVAEALPELEGLTPDPHGVPLDAAGVAELVGPSRVAGLPVTVSVEGTPPADTGDAELFAQRILTESLTNALRHAGRSGTRVRVVHREPVLEVEISDDGPVPGHRPDGQGSGLGLVGMRERVELLGGTLHAGPGDGAGWTVHAVLPRAPLVRGDEAAPAPISSSAPIRSDPLAT